MKWKIVPFDRLTTTDLYALLRLRAAVFIVEQNCVYQDIDNQDQNAYHIIGKKKEENICAYARIIPPKNGYVSIGRSQRKKQRLWKKRDHKGHQILPTKIHWLSNKNIRAKTPRVFLFKFRF